RQAIGNAFATHDVNRLAGLILWRDLDQASARSTLRSLAEWLKQSLTGIAIARAAGPPFGGADPPPDASTGAANATLQPPTGFEISTAEGGTRDFGVTEFGGCWWLTFGVSDARFRAAPRASIPTPPARQGAFRNLMLKLLCALAVIVLTANACSSGRHAVIADAGATPAAAVSVTPAVRDAITAAVTKMAPGAKVQRVAPMPIAGLYQVVSQGQVLYMAGDGRYVIQGDAYDIATRTPLNSLTMNRLR